MIKKVTATVGSYQYVLDMSASESSGALIFDITGIAEHSREITVDKLSNRTVISGISVKQRIITFTIRITAVDVETERKTLRRVFGEGKNVSLLFETDLISSCSISGVVESCENPIFSKESTMVVTIICPDSDFLEEQVTLLTDDVDRVGPNGEVIIGSPGAGTFNNPGDTESGCVISIPLRDEITTGTIGIFNTFNKTFMDMNIEKIISITGSFVDGDIIIVDSRQRKYCVLVRGNTVYNIFSSVTIPYKWIKISPGSNEIIVYGVGSYSSQIIYQPAHGGL